MKAKIKNTTDLKPINLVFYGEYKTTTIKTTKAKKVLYVLAIAPLCSAWLFLVLPFIKKQYVFKKLIHNNQIERLIKE